MPIVQKQHYNKTEFPLLLTHYFGTPQFIVLQLTDQKQKYFLVLPSVLWVSFRSLFLSSYVKTMQTWPTVRPKMAYFKHLQTDIAWIADN